MSFFISFEIKCLYVVTGGCSSKVAVTTPTKVPRFKYEIGNSIVAILFSN